MAALLAVAAAAGAASAWAQRTATPGGIYTCVDDRGRRLTSDRPIAECSSREQHLLNRDGSLRAVIPPTLTQDERAEREARERRAAEARERQADAVRRDRNLMARYRDEATHARARESALEPVRLAQANTERRLADLRRERKPLLDDAEFYVGKSLPFRLKQQLEANDAAIAAVQDAMATQEAEVARINRFYDVELDRLRRLWDGAQPGSLGPLPPVAEASPAPKAASAAKGPASSTAKASTPAR